MFSSCKVPVRTCLLVLRLQHLPVGSVAELPHYFVALHPAATSFESSAPECRLLALVKIQKRKYVFSNASTFQSHI